MSACVTCEAELPPGLTLCHSHTEQLETTLRAVPALWTDLAETIARMDAVGQPGPSTRHATTMEPCNLDAMDKADTLAQVLNRWCDVLGAARVMPAPSAARWLLERVAQIRAADWAGEALAYIQDAARAARNATDRPGARIRYGRCGATDCAATITGWDGNRYAHCEACGETYLVTELKEWRISQAWDHLVTLPEAVRILNESGLATLKLDRVKKWFQRGKLHAHRCQTKDRIHLFQLPDVYATAASMSAVKRKPECPIA